MHTFALKATDSSAAILAHARDPHAAFIAGGTDLIGLIKDRGAHPDRYWISTGCLTCLDRNVAGWRVAHWCICSNERCRRPSRGAPSLSGNS